MDEQAEELVMLERPPHTFGRPSLGTRSVAAAQLDELIQRRFGAR